MPERQLPKTSLDTYDSVKKGDLREGHYIKIKKALEVVGKGNYELIAKQSGLEKHAVNRRLSEMIRLEMLYKTGTTSPTTTGNQAQNYSIIPTDLTVIEHHYKENEKTAGDIASGIIDFTQLDLFSK